MRIESQPFQQIDEIQLTMAQGFLWQLAPVAWVLAPWLLLDLGNTAMRV